MLKTLIKQRIWIPVEAEILTLPTLDSKALGIKKKRSKFLKALEEE
jgi:hypothetical protein